MATQNVPIKILLSCGRSSASRADDLLIRVQGSVAERQRRWHGVIAGSGQHQTVAVGGLVRMDWNDCRLSAVAAWGNEKCCSFFLIIQRQISSSSGERSITVDHDRMITVVIVGIGKTIILLRYWSRALGGEGNVYTSPCTLMMLNLSPSVRQRTLSRSNAKAVQKKVSLTREGSSSRPRCPQHSGGRGKDFTAVLCHVEQLKPIELSGWRCFAKDAPPKQREPSLLGHVVSQSDFKRRGASNLQQLQNHTV